MWIQRSGGFRSCACTDVQKSETKSLAQKMREENQNDTTTKPTTATEYYSTVFYCTLLMHSTVLYCSIVFLTPWYIEFKAGSPGKGKTGLFQSIKCPGKDIETRLPGVLSFLLGEAGNCCVLDA